MQFTLTIELGNDAMQTAFEVTCAFVESMQRNTEAHDPLTRTDTGTIRDANGSTVGKWEVTD